MKGIANVMNVMLASKRTSFLVLQLKRVETELELATQLQAAMGFAGSWP